MPLALYHVTLRSHVKAILRQGLNSQAKPNVWEAKPPNPRGRVHLCPRKRVAYWRMTMEDGWMEIPEGEDLAVVRVDVRGLTLKPDDEGFGDFFVEGDIEPRRILSVKILPGVGQDSS